MSFQERFDKKVKILMGVAAALLLVAISCTWRDSYLDQHQVLGAGKRVTIKYGLYQDCHGVILKEVYSGVAVDRNGGVHASIFAGYAVDLTCNNDHTGDRFFVPDFLRVIRG